MANPLAGLLKLLGSKTSIAAAKAAVPGALINAGLGTLTQGPVAGLAYGAGDFLLNYPLVGMARKLAPGVPGGMAKIKTPEGKIVTRELGYQPSNVEQGVNFAASLASMPVVDLVTQGALYPQHQVVQPGVQSQEQQIYQQATQRERINGLQQQALAPGTQFQAQGIEQTFHYPGITLPPETLALLQEMEA